MRPSFPDHLLELVPGPAPNFQVHMSHPRILLTADPGSADRSQDQGCYVFNIKNKISARTTVSSKTSSHEKDRNQKSGQDKVPPTWKCSFRWTQEPSLPRGEGVTLDFVLLSHLPSGPNSAPLTESEVASPLRHQSLLWYPVGGSCSSPEFKVSEHWPASAWLALGHLNFTASHFHCRWSDKGNVWLDTSLEIRVFLGDLTRSRSLKLSHTHG